MKPWLVAAAPLAFATPAWAQDPHAHHHPPPAQPAPAAADPHAGHHMPAPPASAAGDPHAGHTMGSQPVGDAAPPPVPLDHAADRIFPRAEMDRARALLRREHGDVRWSKVMLETAEVRPSGDGDVWAWEGEASYGGDLNRFVLKSEAEGDSGALNAAEVQALYGRAIGPYFNLQAGVRHDLEPGPQRTYASRASRASRPTGSRWRARCSCRTRATSQAGWKARTTCGSPRS